MFKKILNLFIIFCFLLTGLGPIPAAHAQTVMDLPQPGTLVNLSPAYEPTLIKGLTVHKDNPFLFDFIVDTGHSGLSGEALKNEGDRLVKYFFACLTIPEKDLWVNLSPYEKGRIIPQALGQTAVGRDLLAEDYLLKQLTASLIYPEKNLGKEFWERVYAKSQQLYGTTQIPVNTFNKVWILADHADVYEHNQTAFVIRGHLKVMLDEDYLALSKHQTPTRGHVPEGNVSPSRLPSELALNVKAIQKVPPDTLASQIVRQIVLPEIEKEVNTSKNFAVLRQIFYSQILATWYKKRLKEALLNQIYADKSTVKGINLNDPSFKEKIYQRYLQAYKKGVFNYIKEDTQNGQTVPRKYFSGGYAQSPKMLNVAFAMKTQDLGRVEPAGKDVELDVVLNVNSAAMKAVARGAAAASLNSQMQITALMGRFTKWKFQQEPWVTQFGEHTTFVFSSDLMENTAKVEYLVERILYAHWSWRQARRWQGEDDVSQPVTFVLPGMTLGLEESLGRMIDGIHIEGMTYGDKQYRLVFKTPDVTEMATRSQLIKTINSWPSFKGQSIRLPYVFLGTEEAVEKKFTAYGEELRAHVELYKGEEYLIKLGSPGQGFIGLVDSTQGRMLKVNKNGLIRLVTDLYAVDPFKAIRIVGDLKRELQATAAMIVPISSNDEMRFLARELREDPELVLPKILESLSPKRDDVDYATAFLWHNKPYNFKLGEPVTRERINFFAAKGIKVNFKNGDWLQLSLITRPNSLVVEVSPALETGLQEFLKKFIDDEYKLSRVSQVHESKSVQEQSHIDWTIAPKPWQPQGTALGQGEYSIVEGVGKPGMVLNYSVESGIPQTLNVDISFDGVVVRDRHFKKTLKILKYDTWTSYVPVMQNGQPLFQVTAQEPGRMVGRFKIAVQALSQSPVTFKTPAMITVQQMRGELLSKVEVRNFQEATGLLNGRVDQLNNREITVQGIDPNAYKSKQGLAGELLKQMGLEPVAMHTGFPQLQTGNIVVSFTSGKSEKLFVTEVTGFAKNMGTIQNDEGPYATNYVPSPQAQADAVFVGKIPEPMLKGAESSEVLTPDDQTFVFKPDDSKAMTAAVRVPLNPEGVVSRFWGNQTIQISRNNGAIEFHLATGKKLTADDITKKMTGALSTEKRDYLEGLSSKDEVFLISNFQEALMVVEKGGLTQFFKPVDNGQGGIHLQAIIQPVTAAMMTEPGNIFEGQIDYRKKVHLQGGFSYVDIDVANPEQNVFERLMGLPVPEDNKSKYILAFLGEAPILIGQLREEDRTLKDAMELTRLEKVVQGVLGPKHTVGEVGPQKLRLAFLPLQGLSYRNVEALTDALIEKWGRGLDYGSVVPQGFSLRKSKEYPIAKIFLSRKAAAAMTANEDPVLKAVFDLAGRYDSTDNIKRDSLSAFGARITITPYSRSQINNAPGVKMAGTFELRKDGIISPASEQSMQEINKARNIRFFGFETIMPNDDEAFYYISKTEGLIVIDKFEKNKTPAMSVLDWVEYQGKHRQIVRLGAAGTLGLNIKNTIRYVKPDEVTPIESPVSTENNSWPAALLARPSRGPVDRAALSTINGGIDLNAANMGMTVTKDAHGGVQVTIDPALIRSIQEKGIVSARPIIIRMSSVSEAEIRPLLGLNP